MELKRRERGGGRKYEESNFLYHGGESISGTVFLCTCKDELI